eukprot:UN0540
MIPSTSTAMPTVAVNAARFQTNCWMYTSVSACSSGDDGACACVCVGVLCACVSVRARVHLIRRRKTVQQNALSQ